MRILILFLILSCGSAFAANCNPTDQTGCAQDCSGTVGSMTPIQLPNTGWTQGSVTIPGVDCIYGILWNSGLTCTNNTFGTSVYGCLDAYFIHGVTFSQMDQIWCWHGGGFVGGNREGCFGQGNNYKSPVMLLQYLANKPNSKGVLGGFVVIEADYRLASPLGSNAFPTNWQDMKCAEAYYEAHLGVLNTGFPGDINQVRMTYGPSAGGPMAWWQANSSDSAYTWSCPTAAQTKPTAGYRWVAAWTPMSLALPSANATWDNCSGCTTGAINNLLNCSSSTTCRTADTTLQASPYLLITNGNTSLSPNGMFQFGGSDTLIPPSWSGGGNFSLAFNAYAALTPPVIIPSRVYSAQIHEGDLQILPYAPSVLDAMNFLINRASGGVSGVNGTF
jgi:hypothetical protein